MRSTGAERVARNLEDAPAFWQADGLRFEVERAFERELRGRFAACFDVRAYDGDRLIFRDRIECWDGIPGDVRADLTHTVRVATRRGPWVKERPGTVTTFYAEASDGYVTSEDVDWGDASGGAGGTLFVSDTNDRFLIGGNRPGIAYELQQSFLEFDVSGLPDTDIISDAVLSLMLVQDLSTTDFTVEAREYDFGGSIATGDWRNPSQLTALPLLATLATSGIGSTEAYKDFTDVALVGAIDPTGSLSLVLCSSSLRSGTPHSGDEFVAFYSADETGTGKDPKLVVTHSAPPTYDAEAEVEITANATVSAPPDQQVATNLTLEVDWDNDGDFDEDFEDITEYVLDCQTVIGRDYASHLTGRSSPGQLRALLHDPDGRFAISKASSPLYGEPWLGRKVRLRANSVTPVDPVLLLKDSFDRADGAIGSADVGGAWSATSIVVSNGRATPTGIGQSTFLDSGEVDHFVQMRVGFIPASGAWGGLRYRYTDGNNLGALQGSTTHGLVVEEYDSGATVVSYSYPEPIAEGDLIGVWAQGDRTRVYLNGVAVMDFTGANGTGTSVGFAGGASVGDQPGFDDFECWSTLPVETNGVLWTGTLEDIVPTRVPGPYKTASLSAVGPLGTLPTNNITPSARIPGPPSGVAIGNILGLAGKISPPGPIDLGDVKLGPYVPDTGSALSLLRDVEDVELGLVYETQEGFIGFQQRSGRSLNQAVSAVFSDDTGAPFALRYGSLQYGDRVFNDVFNMVQAGVSPYSAGAEDTLFTDPGPYGLASGETQALVATSGRVLRWTGHTRDVRTGGAPTVADDDDYEFDAGITDYDVPMPATVNAGDLLLVLTNAASATPTNWTNLGGGLFGKVAVGNEDSTNVNFTLSAPSHPVLVHRWRVTSWFGSLAGVEVRISPWYQSNVNYWGIAPSWGAIPSLYIAGQDSPSISLSEPTLAAGPGGGFGNTIFTSRVTGGGVWGYLATSRRTATVTQLLFDQFNITNGAGTRRYWAIVVRGSQSSTTPVSSVYPGGTSGAFTIGYDSGVGGTAQTHENIEVSGIPIVEGDPVTVAAESATSRERYGPRPLPPPRPLFASVADAQLWCAYVLAGSDDVHPRLTLSFVAGKSAAYRTQALNRRVGDRVTVTAENNADLGIDEDFFIESIEHHLSQGNTLHEVVWTLSPASVTDPT